MALGPEVINIWSLDPRGSFYNFAYRLMLCSFLCVLYWAILAVSITCFLRVSYDMSPAILGLSLGP